MGRHAGIAVIEATPKGDRLRGSLEVGILFDDHEVRPGKFENARRVVLREEPRKATAVLRRAGKNHLVDAGTHRLVGGGGRFRQESDEFAIDQTPIDERVNQPAERRAAPFGRLEEDGVARDEGLQKLTPARKSG